MRSRSAGTRDDIPVVFRRNTPNRVGPSCPSTQRICIVHGRVRMASNTPVAHRNGRLRDSLTISARRKAWLDPVVRFGKTFSFGESRPKGLLTGKKVYVFTSRGGTYEPGTPTVQFDFQEPYLRHVLAFIGLTDVTFIHAENQSKPRLAPAAKAAECKKSKMLLQSDAL